jgi:SAM-dependent methyltransferase
MKLRTLLKYTHRGDVGTKNMPARHEWVERKLSEIPAGSRILDAGAGEQQYKKFCSHLQYVSQDFAQYDPGELKSGLQMPEWDYGTLDIVSDITAIPEPDGSFDVVVCFEVLEHVPDPIRAIQELSRLVRAGGKLLISAPFCSITHFAPYHFCTGFNRFFYEKHLSDNGFRITQLEANGNYFEYLAQELRRVQSVSKKYCNSKISWWEKLALNIQLRMLQRFTAQDKGSDELLASGFHVVAEKSN